MTDPTKKRDAQGQDDHAIEAVLDMIDADIRAHPELLVALTDNFFAELERLVAGVVVSDDETLDLRDKAVPSPPKP